MKARAGPYGSYDKENLCMSNQAITLPRHYTLSCDVLRLRKEGGEKVERSGKCTLLCQFKKGRLEEQCKKGWKAITVAL